MITNMPSHFLTFSSVSVFQIYTYKLFYRTQLKRVLTYERDLGWILESQ